MTGSGYVVGGALALLMAGSMFAPAAFSRTAPAEEQSSNACRGLRNAYQACTAGNPDPSQCEHIREQMIAHSCLGSSSSGF